jgi:hypothetical protein
MGCGQAPKNAEKSNFGKLSKKSALFREIRAQKPVNFVFTLYLIGEMP